jgi:hypothetical protein
MLSTIPARRKENGQPQEEIEGVDFDATYRKSELKILYSTGLTTIAIMRLIG